MSYIPPPKLLAAFLDARPVKPKTAIQGGGGLRKRWKDEAGNIYEWDSRHGRVEKYNRSGQHLGEFDPTTGEQLGQANPDYEVELSIKMSFLNHDASLQQRIELDETPHTLSVERVISAYEKEGDRLISEFVLQNASLSELQNLFGEPAQNLMIECYPIAQTEAAYLQQQFHLAFDFDAFDYFLECCAV